MLSNGLTVLSHRQVTDRPFSQIPPFHSDSVRHSFSCNEAFSLRFLCKQTCGILLAPRGGGGAGLSIHLTSLLKSGLLESLGPRLYTGLESFPLSPQEQSFVQLPEMKSDFPQA